MSRVGRLFRTLFVLLLVISFIVTTVSPTFCPVTSPAEEQVYVTDTPTKLVLGATRSQCAFECGFSDKISGRSAGRQPGCRCFNYNSTSANCSLFMFEPTSYGVDLQGNTIAYQFANRLLQGLWKNVSQSECSFPFLHDELVYWQCKNSSVFVKDRQCGRSYNWCQLSNGEQAFCWNATNALKPTDCTEITALGGIGTRSGVYTIYVGLGANQRNISVYCDMTTADSSWTVFQRRMDGSVDFYRAWHDYANGFGSLKGEFWLGNYYHESHDDGGVEVHVVACHERDASLFQSDMAVATPLSSNVCRCDGSKVDVSSMDLQLNPSNGNLNLLTSAKRHILRIDMSTFDGRTSYAEYDNFIVSSSADNYRLVSVGTYNGTAGDSLTYHKGQQFSTYDIENDQSSDNCAMKYKGAWWYNACHASNLNGFYHGGQHTSYADGVEWSTWTGYQYSLKTTEMKIRPA